MKTMYIGRLLIRSIFVICAISRNSVFPDKDMSGFVYASGSQPLSVRGTLSFVVRSRGTNIRVGNNASLIVGRKQLIIYL